MSWKKNGILVCAVLGCLYLQQKLRLAFWGIDLFLVLLIFMCFRSDITRAVLWGLLIGGVQDLFSFQPVGPNLFAKAVVAGAAVFIQNFIYRERVLTRVLLLWVVLIFHEILLGGFYVWKEIYDLEESFVLCFRHVLATGLLGTLFVPFVQMRLKLTDPATA